MFTIRIDLLTGRYAATAYNDRERAEWPPHPARLFSALVATWADGQPGTAEGDAELAALRWLECLPAPIILASATAHRGERSGVTVFVPVNDVGVIRLPDHSKLEEAERALSKSEEGAARTKAAKQLAALEAKLVADTAKETAAPTKFGKHDAAAAEQALLDRRTRQPRSFPCAVPDVPAFAFEWRDVDAPDEMVEVLSRLAKRLVRIGHSSSMVHARIIAGAKPDDLGEHVVRFVPDDDGGELMIRWVGAGQVERLMRAHERHQQVEPRVLPAKFVRYREGARAQSHALIASVFESGSWIIYARAAGPRLSIGSTAGLSRQFRRALMSAADQPVPELLSGHLPDGSPSQSPHLAIVPLPAVSGPHPDGALLGVALVLPRGTTAEMRHVVARALGRLEQRNEPASGDEAAVTIDLGDTGSLRLARVWGQAARWTLRDWSWTRPSCRWASATPVALDHNPGNLHDPDPAVRARAFEAARASVVESVKRIGLGPPIEVDVVRSCVLPGTARPRAYPRFPIDARKPQRVLVHVRLVFDQPVRGPVLIGAGRYHGMGLCAPVDPWSESP